MAGKDANVSDKSDLRRVNVTSAPSRQHRQSPRGTERLRPELPTVTITCAYPAGKVSSVFWSSLSTVILLVHRTLQDAQNNL